MRTGGNNTDSSPCEVDSEPSNELGRTSNLREIFADGGGLQVVELGHGQEHRAGADSTAKRAGRTQAIELLGLNHNNSVVIKVEPVSLA